MCKHILAEYKNYYKQRNYKSKTVSKVTGVLKKNKNSTKILRLNIGLMS